MDTASDVIADLGEAFLGSRLKRLAERLQGAATRFVTELGIDVQPAQMGLLAALDRSPMTIGQLAEAVGTSQPGVTRAIGQLIEKGFVVSSRGEDLRQKTLELSPSGKAIIVRIKAEVWPRLGSAVRAITDELSGSFLEQVAGIEAALFETPLENRAAQFSSSLRLREYSPELQPIFKDINVEWISDLFALETADLEVLDDPQTHILDSGGAILFVESPSLGIIGTCALRRTGPKSAELTKMGVRASARGQKAGEFLLGATIARAEQMGIEDLYLLTNSKAEAAIHLYEKLGFEHSREVMSKYGERYERANVAMQYSPPRPRNA